MRKSEQLCPAMQNLVLDLRLRGIFTKSRFSLFARPQLEDRVLDYLPHLYRETYLLLNRELPVLFFRNELLSYYCHVFQRTKQGMKRMHFFCILQLFPALQDEPHKVFCV